MKEKTLLEAIAEEDEIRRKLSEKYRADAAERTARLQAAAAKKAVLDAGTFKSKNVELTYDGELFINDGYDCVSFYTPEAIESLYLQLKKALNK